MKVMVTGPDGLLGSNLVRELLERDYEVRALVFSGSKSNTLDGLNIEKVNGNILDAESVTEASKGCEGIFHVAASTAMWPPRDPIITKINVVGTRNVLDAAEKNGIKRVVHVGTASSIGYGTKKKPGTEETPYKYGHIRLAYFESKLEAQKMVIAKAKEGKIECVVVNPTFMFGPHDSIPSSGAMITRYVKMNVPVYSPGGRCFAHARDVAAGAAGAMEKGRNGELYLLGNENLNMKELLSIVADVAGIRKPFIEAPEPLLKLFGRIGSRVGEITGKKPQMSYEEAIGACTGAYYSAAKAVRELDMPQTPIEIAIEDSYRWLKDNGYMDN